MYIYVYVLFVIYYYIIYYILYLYLLSITFTAKTTKDGEPEPCKPIQKVEWKLSRSG